MTEENQKPGYKQAWPWFVISIPLLTVVAGIITFIISMYHPQCYFMIFVLVTGLTVFYPRDLYKPMNIVKWCGFLLPALLGIPFCIYFFGSSVIIGEGHIGIKAFWTYSSSCSATQYR